jgi:hypothetical protein
MNGSFGERANALYGIAARMLGWRPGDFWAATPAELAAALSPPHPAAAEGLDRSELERMMEADNA